MTHDVRITLAGVGYQARCSCGWRGVQRANDTAIRDAKREGDKHKRVPASEANDA